MKIRFWSTKPMAEIPKRYHYFRVGPHIGWCALKTPWFVVMVTPKEFEYHE